jgi:hypothetical protein
MNSIQLWNSMTLSLCDIEDVTHHSLHKQQANNIANAVSLASHVGLFLHFAFHTLW